MNPPPIFRAMAGWLMVTSCLTVPISVAGYTQINGADIGYWVAALLLSSFLPNRSRRQCIVLILLGLGCFVLAAARGTAFQLAFLSSPYSAIISMLIGVSFLTLVAEPDGTVRRYPIATGKPAVASSLLGLHLFGAVINISAVFIFGDRMAKNGTLEKSQAIVLARAFAAANFWSPFFVAMALSLTYAPSAKLSLLLLAGLPLALLALALTYYDVLQIHGARDFVGYPLCSRNVWLPLLLSGGVLCFLLMEPSFSVPTIITLLAPGLTLLLLAPRPRHGLHRVRDHIEQRLPRMGNELSLFLAAGVLSKGLQTLLTTMPEVSLFAQFEAAEASACYIAIVILSLIGVHPVVSISFVGALLENLTPDPSLIALTFLCSWSMGSTVNPLSSQNLGMQGRYGLDAYDLVRWNLRYATLMSLAVILVLHSVVWLST